MKKLLRLAVRLYPGAWRDRYGVEFRALLDQITPGWLDVVDVLEGGLQMHLRRVHPAWIAATVGLVGALVAGVAALNTADRFVSKGTMSVRTSSPEDVMPRLVTDAFDRNTLTGIIEKYRLYPGERASSSVDNVVHHMRGDIGIERLSPNGFQASFAVSFASSDDRTAQHVVQELMSRLIRSNFDARSNVQLKVDMTAETRRSIDPRRVTLAGAGGFGGGALIGTAIVFLRRRVTRGAGPRADP